MPSDPFYGGTCVEVRYPNDIMNNHFSEPEWTTASNPVSCSVILECSVVVIAKKERAYDGFVGTPCTE